jgi:hypothetical protein
MDRRRTNPASAYRISEQNTDTNQRSLTRQTNPPEIRAQENERNAAYMQQDVLIHHTEWGEMKGMLKLWQQEVLIHHTEHRKMKGMLKLWQQVVVIQHTEDMSKLLGLIKEDQQDKLILQR